MTKKKFLLLSVSFLTIVSGSACSNDNVMPEPENENGVNEGTGGAFLFHSVQSEGYSVANMLVPMGYQCFVVNYHIAPTPCAKVPPACNVPSAMCVPMQAARWRRISLRAIPMATGRQTVQTYGEITSTHS